MFSPRRASVEISWPCCRRRLGSQHSRCSRSRANLISPRARSYFQQERVTHGTSEFLLRPERFLLPDTPTLGPHSFSPAPASLVRSSLRLPSLLKRRAVWFRSRSRNPAAKL